MMIVGNIYNNPYAGKKNPLKHSIYIGHYEFIYFSDNQIKRAKYDKETIKKFIKVNKSKGYELIKAELAICSAES